MESVTNNIGRRQSLQTAGAAAASVLLGKSIYAANLPADKTIGIEQVKSRSGQVVIRLQFQMSEYGKESNFAARLAVKGAKVANIQEYFFEDGEDRLTADYGWQCRLTKGDIDVLVVRLEDASADTVIEIKGNSDNTAFTLGELLASGEITDEIDGAETSANFLLDKEIGKIDLAQTGIKNPGDDFDFVIFADPQGGDPTDTTNDSPERIKIHNEFVVKNVELVNNLQPRPVFLIIDGDIVDSSGQKTNYDSMLQIFSKLQVPMLFEVGNHETPYSSKFYPAYNMEPMKNYLEAQNKVNSLDKIVYSFDAGRWHFIIWPDPLRPFFWERHPHYFQWLENDLLTHKNKPVMFFQHISLLPLGIDPMIDYSEKVPVKRTLLNILAKYGNVKYVFSGHTHIQLRASFKTAKTYKGMKFINLPPAGYRPRAFGEEELDSGPSQGFAIVSVKGENIKVRYEMVTGKVYSYPDQLPEFVPAQWPLWLMEEYNLPLNSSLVNGNFENGLNGWFARYIYMEDKNPSNVCQVDPRVKHSGSGSLRMFCRARGAKTPGQDRLPQTINRIAQAVKVPAGANLRLKAYYRIESENYIPASNSGACILVQGFNGSSERLNMAYWTGRAIFNAIWPHIYTYFDITSSTDAWHGVDINIGRDYERTHAGKRFDSLELDRLVITLGVWNGNMVGDEKFGLHFDDISIDFETNKSDIPSTVDGKLIEVKNENEIWDKVLIHIAGEHAFQDRVKK